MLIKTVTSVLVLVFVISFIGESNAQSYESEIVVYGATASGVMASIASAREGNEVMLFEPGEYIGGMVTGGLSHTDYGNRAVIGGLALEFYQRVGKHYNTHAYHWRGPEPHVGEKILKEMLSEAGVIIHFNKRVDKVIKEDKQIRKIRFIDGSEVTAKVFIDAGYEGDLMARSGVSYSIGRESVDKHNESYAGRQPVTFTRHQIDVGINPFIRDSVVYGAEGNGAIIPIDYDTENEPNELLPLINPRKMVPIGKGDGGVQSYCFRLIATDRPGNMLPWEKPENYDPSKFELARRYYKANPNGPSLIGFWSNLPNDKGDINSGPGISTNLLDGSSWEYPDADYSKRDSLWQWHEDYTLGLAYFLANDESVPDRIREYMNSFGLAKDEYVDNNHFPHQLYIREGRRMQGEYVMTQHDMMSDTLKYDSIGMGSYNIDVREVQRNYIEISAFPNLRYETYNEGYLSIPVAPYEISYRSIVPKFHEIQNLIVPVTLSGSHVFIASVRMEPQYMLLGHSAGVAASMAVNNQRTVQQIDIKELQGKLEEQGQVLSLQENIYGALNSSKEEIVIDNSMSDFARMSGTWVNAAWKLHPERYEMNYLESPKGEAGVFQFRPYFFKSGNYDTFIWHPSSNDFDNNVDIQIYSNHGIETVTINQQVKGGEWVHIGRFFFQEGQSPAVEILAKDNEYVTAVDAIKFQYVD